MFALDDRTGNILTTIAVFVAVVAVVFVARAALVAFVFGLLLAYVLEPIVSGTERLLPKTPRARAVSIAVVFTIGTLAAVAVAYGIAPTVVGQVRQLNAAWPDLAARANAIGAGDHTAAVAGLMTRLTRGAASATEDLGWLLLVPVVAVFFLGNRTSFFDSAVDLLANRGDRTGAKCTIQQIDHALAEYTRGQLILAGLSVVFYGVSMALFGVPYAMPLAVIGGILEFVPVLGWIVAAAAMLVSASLAHAHWVWMAASIVAWRIVQNFVTSPRVMGDRLQIEPLTVLFAMTVGGEIGGIAGVVLSIPIVAVARIVWSERSTREASPVALVKP